MSCIMVFDEDHRARAVTFTVSLTHEVHPIQTRNVNQPETLADLEALVKEAHEKEKRRGSDPLPRVFL